MRCVVHIRKSVDYPGQHFVLRLFPLYTSDFEERRPVETFNTEESLSERLTGIGLPRAYMAATFSNLYGGSDAMWTNIEIAQATFDQFGRAGDRRPGDWPLIAA
jgi:hypothetical protein